MRRMHIILLSICLVFIFSVSTSAQNVQDFRFSSFDGVYELSLDDEDRAVMLVTETLVAEFPDRNQNKGIVREIPRTYQGRPLSFELISLERNGEPEPVYEQTRSGDFMVISTGTDSYVRGTQTYELSYRLRDVILDTGNSQELFWDINGTGWRQPFDSVSATLQLDEAIQESLTGRVTCFQGPADSQEPCEYAVQTDGTIEFNSTRPFSPTENLSIVVEFEPNTFAPYAEGTGGTMRALLAGLAIVSSLLALRLANSVRRRGRDHPGRGLTVRQYIPPKDISVLFAAVTTGNNKFIQKAVTAELLDLAVKKHIQIIDTGKIRLFGIGNNTYEIKLIQTKGLRSTSESLLQAFFGDTLRKDATHELHKASSSTGRKLASLQQSLKSEVVSRGYRRKTTGIVWPLVTAGIGSVLAGSLLAWMSSVGLPFDVTNDWRTWVIIGSFISTLVSILIISTSLRPLTKKGRELVDHIEGMKEYISLAEAERLRFAQSPDGAQRQRINTDDPAEIIRLYERLLPYAVLFGDEKKWFQELGQYYEQQSSQPAWYAGTGAFSASNFSSSMSQISSVATSSSSSGFSGGGGSGGGGGGGGGGGR